MIGLTGGHITGFVCVSVFLHSVHCNKYINLCQKHYISHKISLLLSLSVDFPWEGGRLVCVCVSTPVLISAQPSVPTTVVCASACVCVLLICHGAECSLSAWISAHQDQGFGRCCFAAITSPALTKKRGSAAAS